MTGNRWLSGVINFFFINVISIKNKKHSFVFSRKLSLPTVTLIISQIYVSIRAAFLGWIIDWLAESGPEFDYLVSNIETSECEHFVEVGLQRKLVLICSS